MADKKTTKKETTKKVSTKKATAKNTTKETKTVEVSKLFESIRIMDGDKVNTVKTEDAIVAMLQDTFKDVCVIESTPSCLKVFGLNDDTSKRCKFGIYMSVTQKGASFKCSLHKAKYEALMEIEDLAKVTKLTKGLIPETRFDMDNVLELLKLVLGLYI